MWFTVDLHPEVECWITATLGKSEISHKRQGRVCPPLWVHYEKYTWMLSSFVLLIQCLWKPTVTKQITERASNHLGQHGAANYCAECADLLRQNKVCLLKISEGEGLIFQISCGWNNWDWKKMSNMHHICFRYNYLQMKTSPIF